MSRQEGSVKYAWGRKMLAARPNNLERNWRMGRGRNFMKEEKRTK